jgi:hypothetical protein
VHRIARLLVWEVYLRVVIGFGIVLPVVVVLALAGSMPSYARAQSDTAPQSDSSLQHVITRIGLDGPNTVRLVSRGTERFEGEGIRLLGDSVWVDTETGLRTIAVADVDSLWAQHGTAARTVGLIAAVPCAVFGAMVGEFIATDPDGNGRPGRGPIGALIGAVIGGAPCGLLGAVLGSFFRRWRLEYARTAQPTSGPDSLVTRATIEFW